MNISERLYRLVPFDTMPTNVTPPATLGRFVWHFAGQAWRMLVLLVVFEAVTALMMALIPSVLGRTVNMAIAGRIDAPLLAFGAALLVLMPLSSLMLGWFYDHVYTPRFGNMMRRQLHHYTLGHSLSYFYNDYAGRIASKVMESGPALRDTVRSSVAALWHAAFYAGSAMVLLAQAGGIVVVPVLVWFVAYVAILRVFVPRVRARAMRHSEVHSTLLGRVVDTYTNILTLKLFGRQQQEDERAYATLSEHVGTMRATNHAIWVMRSIISVANSVMMVATCGLALYAWQRGNAPAGLVAMALPLVWQLNNMSGWIMGEVTGVFENLGRVEECMRTIARPHTVTDVTGAAPLSVERGDICYEDVTFHYGKGAGVIAGLNLHIRPGEKVGLVGKSGAGKSTLVNLLLRTYDLEGGRILVDGQDIARVSQDTLREQVAVVTQESSLLNRSIRDNLRIGRPDATDEEMVAAAKRAHAHGFILNLTDFAGRTGYDSQVGERGVKLSGGQRQRIALARVFLKNAPILILDEATSALDSEAEGEILKHLDALMEGKTVLAIAHRLSTLQSMDRIVVLDQGQVVEDGSHEDLLRQGGVYAGLWRAQSGGFIAE